MDSYQCLDGQQVSYFVCQVDTVTVEAIRTPRD